MMQAHIKNWKNMKFGMFIHWGLYSILGEGEWAMFNKPICKEEYAKLAEQFTAEAFDAKKWAELAKSAGMKYMVLTTRHHDGFSLFNSKASVGDFTSTNSAAKRDCVEEYTEACREEGLAVGLYYSPLDWRFPGYFAPRLYRDNAHELKAQCHNQIRELLTNYGKIDVLWYDGGEDYWLAHGRNIHSFGSQPDNWRENPQIENFWEADKLDQMARELQPGIVINNRSGQRQYGDFLTPEGKIGEFNLDTPWETCDTLSGSWGWKPNSKIKSLRNIISLLIRVVTGGGNLLLNVGPKADGSVEPNEIERLNQIGKWLEKYGESIYDTNGGPFRNGEWGGTTWKGNKLYIHILEWNNDCIKLPLLDAKIERIESLTASQVNIRETADGIELTVPDGDKEAMDTIIVLELDRNVNEAVKEANGSLESSMKQTSDALVIH